MQHGARAVHRVETDGLGQMTHAPGKRQIPGGIKKNDDQNQPKGFDLHGSVSSTQDRGTLLLRFLAFDKLLALRAKRQILARFLIQAAPLVTVEQGFTDKPGNHSGPEIELAVEALNPIDQFSAVETRVLIIRKLVSGFVG